ncbi:MAG: hypothetical protein GY707_04185 [Desulfobacteraceae bacterium]|nr:hypothetical protein [Desulfobacteraceae bacterium]
MVKYFILFCISLTLLGQVFISKNALASDAEFIERKACFDNFIRCELTRTSAKNYFNGKPFTITMVNFFDIKKEGDIIIFTGAVKCWVSEKYINLHVAVGVKEIFEKRKVSYLVIRKENFSILATELMNYPYKERCDWTQYWVDID